MITENMFILKYATSRVLVWGILAVYQRTQSYVYHRI